MTGQLMTKGDFARARGVRPGSVSNWINQGLVVFGYDPERPEKEMIDVDQTDALLREHLDPGNGRPRAQTVEASRGLFGDDGSVASARGLELRERTMRLRLQNAKAVDKLVAVDDVAARFADAARLIRERWASSDRQLCERLASERDERQVLALLSAARDEILNQVAEMLSRSAILDQAGGDGETRGVTSSIEIGGGAGL